MKWTSAVAIAVGLLTKGPVFAALILAASVIIIVIATYILIAHRNIAPRIKWGALRIDFTQVPPGDDDSD